MVPFLRDFKPPSQRANQSAVSSSFYTGPDRRIEGAARERRSVRLVKIPRAELNALKADTRLRGPLGDDVMDPLRAVGRHLGQLGGPLRAEIVEEGPHRVLAAALGDGRGRSRLWAAEPVREADSRTPSRTSFGPE